MMAGRPCTPNTTAARPSRPSGRAWAVAVLLGALVVVPTLSAGSDAVRGGGPPPSSKAQYAAFRAAWMARDAARVVALVERRSRLQLNLRAPRVAGNLQPAHATRTLKKYFEEVTVVQLKDVTKARPRDQSGYTVRHYDYTYAPRGHDRVTMRLTVTMRLYGRRYWMLISIVETPRPRR